jgi:ABC-type bacteriocin/lantibiotic exporter with double-glycine peptidase domain
VDTGFYVGRRGEISSHALDGSVITPPRILLFDEAPSALESASGQAVLQSLEDLKKEIGIISVAHRLASVRSAGRILVM